MITIEVFRLTGKSPLMMNNPASMQQGSPSEISTGKQIPEPAQEAEAACYRDADGIIYLPTTNFRASLVQGCKGRKVGKKFASSMVKAGVFAADLETIIFDPSTGQPCTTYIYPGMRCVLRSNKAAVIRYRPQILPWAADVHLEVDSDFINAKQVEQLLHFAGRIAGVGEFRPANSGPYGRYTATHIDSRPMPDFEAAE